jgi:uncharacterized protein with von Willebrand factor type A (vWA) domain
MDEPTGLLLPLFAYLRRYGVPLGMGDYLLALNTLRAGWGLDDPGRFKSTCRLLWAKSLEDQAMFDYAFDVLVAPRLWPQTVSTSDGAGTVDSDARDGPDGVFDRALAHRAPSGQNLVPAGDGNLRQRAMPLAPRTTEMGPRAGDQVRGTYQLTPRPPMTQREMAIVWRLLRRPQRDGPLVDVDVDGTIKEICQQGFLFAPVMQARYRNQAQLLVLIDSSSSMEPFAPLVDALLASIDRGGLAGRARRYFFRNCPVGYVSPHPGLTSPRLLRRVLAEEAAGTSILIVSDGGAARGAYRKARVTATATFLETLSTYTYRYAWLNPLPSDRWESTTAEDVAQLVSMSALSREGLIDAVNILRGHPSPPKAGPHAGR